MRALPLIVACLAALPAVAEDTGTFSVTADGMETSIGIAEVERWQSGGTLFLTIGGQADDSALTAQVMVIAGAPEGGLRLELRRDGGALVANQLTGGTLQMTGVEIAEGTLTAFDFAGLAVPRALVVGGALAPVEAGQGVPVEGRFEGRIALE